MMIYRHWAAGYVEEVLNGRTFMPAGVCSHQAWSESMVLQPLLEGMLGYRVDARTGSLTLKPWFPPHWNNVHIHSLKVGAVSVECSMVREQHRTIFRFKASRKSSVTITFQPMMPLGTLVEEIQIDGKRIRSGKMVRTFDESPSSTVKLEKESEVVLVHRGGVGIVPQLPVLEPGKASEGLRIISESYANEQYVIECEGLSGRTYELQIVDRDSMIVAAENAELAARQESLAILRVSFEGDKPFMKRTITLRLRAA